MLFIYKNPNSGLPLPEGAGAAAQRLPKGICPEGTIWRGGIYVVGRGL